MGIKIYLNGKIIKIILARRNKDIQWLADEIGTSRWSLYHWLEKSRCPNPDTRTKIQTVLGNNCPWEDLFSIVNSTMSSTSFQNAK